MACRAWLLVLLLVSSVTLALPVAAGDLRPVPAWNVTLGGSGNDYADAVAQTSDGGYVLAGYTTSPHDGDVGSTLAELGDQLDPADSGHSDVGEDGVRRPDLGAPEGLEPVRGGMHHITLPAQQGA